MADGGAPLAGSRHRSETPTDDFERIKRRMALLGLSSGALASLVAAAFASRVGLPNPVDAHVLPFLGAGLLALSIALWRSPRLLPWIERTGWSLLTAYLLAALAYKVIHFPFEHVPLGARSYWFFFSYLLAFLIWSPRGALTVSLSVIACLTGLAAWISVETHAGNATLLASLIQLVIASIAYVFVHYSFAQLRPQYARMRTLAFSDPLTGCANRRRAEELLALEVSRAGRYARPLSLILFDLDHFKQINDQHGHAIGDAVLRTVTNAVRSDLRGLDHLARWGGEEFVIIAPELSQARAMQFGERLRKRIAALRIGSSIQPTASFGIASFRLGETVDSMVLRADRAMYRAKAQGRNRVELERPQTAAAEAPETVPPLEETAATAAAPSQPD
ncbi:GGDEF domain-containing protein [Acidihalobacter prosperus]|nr:GGDEF domain-containing protein [Acidihalobacter prosperus]